MDIEDRIAIIHKIANMIDDLLALDPDMLDERARFLKETELMVIELENQYQGVYAE